MICHYWSAGSFLRFSLSPYNSVTTIVLNSCNIINAAQGNSRNASKFMQQTNKLHNQTDNAVKDLKKMQQCISIQIYTGLKISMQQQLIATIFHLTISNLHGSCRPLTRLVTTKTPFLHLDYSWVVISIILHLFCTSLWSSSFYGKLLTDICSIEV